MITNLTIDNTQDFLKAHQEVLAKKSTLTELNNSSEEMVRHNKLSSNSVLLSTLTTESLLKNYSLGSKLFSKIKNIDPNKRIIDATDIDWTGYVAQFDDLSFQPTSTFELLDLIFRSLDFLLQEIYDISCPEVIWNDSGELRKVHVNWPDTDNQNELEILNMINNYYGGFNYETNEYYSMIDSNNNNVSLRLYLNYFKDINKFNLKLNILLPNDTINPTKTEYYNDINLMLTKFNNYKLNNDLSEIESCIYTEEEYNKIYDIDDIINYANYVNNIKSNIDNIIKYLNDILNNSDIYDRFVYLCNQYNTLISNILKLDDLINYANDINKIIKWQ